MKISESLLRKIVREVIEESPNWWGSEWDIREEDPPEESDSDDPDAYVQELVMHED